MLLMSGTSWVGFRGWTSAKPNSDSVGGTACGRDHTGLSLREDSLDTQQWDHMGGLPGQGPIGLDPVGGPAWRPTMGLDAWDL